MWRVIQRLGVLVRDVGYGVHAGNAIRHGLPVPDGARRPGCATEDRQDMPAIRVISGSAR